jgi:hypothetical protein
MLPGVARLGANRPAKPGVVRNDCFKGAELGQPSSVLCEHGEPTPDRLDVRQRTRIDANSARRSLGPCPRSSQDRPSTTADVDWIRWFAWYPVKVRSNALSFVTPHLERRAIATENGDVFRRSGPRRSKGRLSS